MPCLPALSHLVFTVICRGRADAALGSVSNRTPLFSVASTFEALISTGTGWMDAAPEITRIRPDIYLVNEDGDKPEKRAFCEEHGLEYVVLKRLPKEGLTRRSSTDLRGF